MDEATYDAVPVGGQTPVRYLAWRPGVFRLASQSTWSALPWSLLAQAAVVVSIVPLCWFWLRARPLGRWSMRSLVLVAGAWLAAVVVLVLKPELTDGPPAPERATATVRTIYAVKHSALATSGWKGAGDPALSAPYDLVELELTPPGAAGSVVAVDGVDVGSAANLRRGSAVAVVYPTGRPREARLAQATRAHRAENGRLLALSALVWIALGVGLLLLQAVLGTAAGWARQRSEAGLASLEQAERARRPDGEPTTGVSRTVRRIRGGTKPPSHVPPP